MVGEISNELMAPHYQLTKLKIVEWKQDNNQIKQYKLQPTPLETKNNNKIKN